MVPELFHLEHTQVWLLLQDLVHLGILSAPSNVFLSADLKFCVLAMDEYGSAHLGGQNLIIIIVG